MGIAPGFEARLFAISTSQGYLHMKEVVNFSQEDLNINDVMVLDAYSTVFMWMGTRANKTEQTKSGAKVEKYIAGLSDRDPSKVQIVQIDPCGEP